MNRRRTVLVVSNLYPPVVRGGYEVECRDAVEHLRAEDDVVVLTSRRHRRRVPDEEDVLRLLPFSDQNTVGVLRAPVASARGARTVAGVLRRVRPDVVFLWNGAGLPHEALRMLFCSGIPVVVRVCQEWFAGLYRDDLHLRYRRPGWHGHHAPWAALVRALDRLPVAPPSGHPPVPVAVLWNSAYLAAVAAPPKELDIVHAAVLPPVTAAAERFSDLVPALAPDLGHRVDLLVVARIEHLKGIDVAVRAVAELRDRHGVRARLQVVGDGEDAERAELRTLAVRLAVDVEFAGVLRGAALRSRVEQAHAWIVPSRAGESAPMVAIEAGFARVPLVAARVGGLPELLREPDEAVFFDPDDAIGCARVVHDLLVDPGRTAERVVAARRRAGDLGVDAYRRRLRCFLDSAVEVLTSADHREPTG